MKVKCLALIVFVLFVSSAFAQTPEETKLPSKFTGIPKAPSNVVIDSDLKEWSLSSAIFISDPSTQPLEDCSGVFYMMWDEKNLYFAAKVYDDDLVQGFNGADIFNEDDVQFDLDIDRNGDRNATGFNDDDCQTGFSPGDFAKEKPEIWGWNPGSGKAVNMPEDSEIASAKFDKGWVIEARIGIEEFNADLTGIKKLEEGMTIGFGRCINDPDKDGEGGVSSGGAWEDTSKMYDVNLIGPYAITPRLKLATTWGLLKRS